MFDWSLTMTFIKDLITAVAATVGIFVAIDGLSTWKKQIKGKTQYDFARSLLTAVYKLRNAIDDVRNPTQSIVEIYSAVNEESLAVDLQDPDWSYKSQTALFKQRWKKIDDAILEIDVLHLEAEVTLDKEISTYLTELKGKIQILKIRIEDHLLSISEAHKRSFDEMVRSAIGSIVKGQLSDNSNKFSREVNEIIEKIENSIKPYLNLS